MVFRANMIVADFILVSPSGLVIAWLNVAPINKVHKEMLEAIFMVPSGVRGTLGRPWEVSDLTLFIDNGELFPRGIAPGDLLDFMDELHRVWVSDDLNFFWLSIFDKVNKVGKLRRGLISHVHMVLGAFWIQLKL